MDSIYIIKPLSSALQAVLSSTSQQDHEKISWERRESKPGLLGEKQVCYLCAMQLHDTFRMFIAQSPRLVLWRHPRNAAAAATADPLIALLRWKQGCLSMRKSRTEPNRVIESPRANIVRDEPGLFPGPSSGSYRCSELNYRWRWDFKTHCSHRLSDQVVQNDCSKQPFFSLRSSLWVKLVGLQRFPALGSFTLRPKDLAMCGQVLIDQN